MIDRDDLKVYCALLYSVLYFTLLYLTLPCLTLPYTLAPNPANVQPGQRYDIQSDGYNGWMEPVEPCQC